MYSVFFYITDRSHDNLDILSECYNFYYEFYYVDDIHVVFIVSQSFFTFFQDYDPFFMIFSLHI